jgi:hypothetical protein
LILSIMLTGSVAFELVVNISMIPLVFPFYVITVLTLRMSRGAGITILAITGFYTFIVGMFGIFVFGTLSTGLSKVPLGGFVAIGAFLILWMALLYWGILGLKAGYQCLVADNFTRMLSADSYRRGLFSWASLSRSLGLPFSMEHIRRRRLTIITYLIISNMLYAIFITAMATSLPLLALMIMATIGVFGTVVGEISIFPVLWFVVFGLLCLVGSIVTGNAAKAGG